MEETTNTVTHEQRLEMLVEGAREQFGALVRYYLVEIEAQEHYDALDEYEIDGIVNDEGDLYFDKSSTLDESMESVASAVVSGKLRTYLESAYLKTLQARIHYYKATFRVTQEFDVWIKAKDEYQAESIASSLSCYDLEDCTDLHAWEYELLDISSARDICEVPDYECFTDD